MNSAFMIPIDVVSSAPNRIMFFRKDFRSDEEMLQSVYQQVKLCLMNHYAFSMFDNSEGIVFELGSTNPMVGDATPVWILPDEIEVLYDYKQEKQELYKSHQKDNKLSNGGGNNDA